MKLDPILSKASRLSRSGKFEAALRVLEPEVNRYHGSFRYYYLAGATCLYAGDFGGALTYFRLAHETKSRDPLALLGLGALYLRRSETDRAVNLYLDVLEIDPNNRIAKKAMKIIRRQAGTEAFTTWLEAGKLSTLYPRIPFPGFTVKEKVTTLSVFLAACIIAFGLVIHLRLVPNPFIPHSSRQGYTDFALTREERLAPLQSGGSYLYVFDSRAQAIETYERALSLFTAHRDEAARINLNRILESNADQSLKNRAAVIITYLEAPAGFDDFRRDDNTAFSVVDNNPVLFHGVHVIWQGRAVNVRTGPGGTSFDFLIGHETRHILEGIVHVRFDFAVPINPERPLEVLGRVLPLGEDGLVNLQGLAIHQSARLEN